MVTRLLTKTVSLMLERPRAGWWADRSLCWEREAGVLHLLRPGEEQAGAVQTAEEEELFSHHWEGKPQVPSTTAILARNLLLLTYRQQLEDTKADISILRDNISKTGKNIRRKSSESDDKSNKRRRESREVLIGRMEELQLKHKSLKQDLQRLLDEKEDIVREKEEMNIKV